MKGCQEYGRLAYSQDGIKLACCGKEGIAIRDARSGEQVNELSDIGYVFDLAYSQDGRFLASGGMNFNVRIWDAATFTAIAVYKGHAGHMFSVSFSSKGSTLLSASFKGKIIRWNMVARRMSGAAVRESNIRSAAYSSDGRSHASASKDGSLRVWTVGSHFHTEPLSVNEGLLQASRSPGGSEIAFASSGGEVRIFSLPSTKLLRTLRGHMGKVNTVAFRPDGGLLASGSGYKPVRVWNAATGLEIRKFEGHTRWTSGSNVDFLLVGKQILSSSVDGTVRRWNITDDDTNGTMLASQTCPIRFMCTSLNEKLLAFGEDDGLIRFGEISTGEMSELRTESNAGVRTLAFSPDGIYLASGMENHIIRLWNLETQAEVRTFNGHTNVILSLSFSQNGQQLLSSSGDNATRQWRVDTGEEMRRLKGLTNAIRCSIFSVHEKHVVSCSIDGTTRIWNADVEENACIPELSGNLTSLELENGWIKTKAGKLLLWIPSEYRNGFMDMSEKCVSTDAPGHPVRLG